MSILDTASERAAWLARAHTLILALQALETQISIAFLDQPTSSQAIHLMSADHQLGVAARALMAAAEEIRRMP